MARAEVSHPESPSVINSAKTKIELAYQIRYTFQQDRSPRDGCEAEIGNSGTA